MRLVAHTKDIPYADCYFIEEDYLITMPEGCSSSSIIRISINIHWLKSTMMKSIIQTQSKKESIA